MKIVLKNIFMCLVIFWKCFFPPPSTQNPSPHNRKTTKTPPPTPPQQQQKNQRSKKESKKSKSHRNVDRFVGQSKSYRKSKWEREREIGSWVRGAKALGCRWSRRLVSRRLWVEDRFVARRLWVAGEVEGSWVKGSRSKIGSWVRRSTKSKALSLSLFVFARESRNGFKWKFSLQTISGSKPSKHTVNWK